jgi:hypothetical protein
MFAIVERIIEKAVAIQLLAAFLYRASALRLDRRKQIPRPGGGGRRVVDHPVNVGL